MKTKEKYLRFLEDLHSSDYFKSNEKAEQHKVSNAIIPALKKMGMVIREGNRFRWVGEVPTMLMVNRLMRIIKRKNKPVELSGITLPAINEEDAIHILKASSKYTYEIYRFEKIRII